MEEQDRNNTNTEFQFSKMEKTFESEDPSNYQSEGV